MLQEIPDWIQDNALKGDNVYSIATDISIEVINYMQIVATVSAFYDVTWPDSLTGLFGICEVIAPVTAHGNDTDREGTALLQLVS